MRFPFAREGRWHMAIALGVTLLLFVFEIPILPWIALVVSLLVVNFFRDPERTPPDDPQLMIAPADGRVIKVEAVDDDRFLDGPAMLVSIFMSPVDVHVNRIPADGKVVDIRYKEGGFYRAYADNASLDNEQNAVIVERSDGTRFCFVQISGFLARRIVSYLELGQPVHRGERYGMIMFGSRADIYLPRSAQVLVENGQRTRAGETAIARWT